MDENLSSDEGKYLEIKMIKLIGRHDLKKGSLTNQTDGGDSTGYKHSKKSIAKMKKYQSENSPFKGKKRPEHSKMMKGNNPMKTEEAIKNHLKACTSERFVENARKNGIGEKNPFYGKEHTYETKQKLRDIFSLKIEQIDIKTLKVINIYESIKDAIKETNIGNISGCCRGKYLSRGGYYWEYCDKNLKIKYKKDILKIRKKGKRVKGISQYDKNDNLLNTFDNTATASRKTRTNPCNILKCCKNQQEFSNGFVWKYCDG